MDYFVVQLLNGLSFSLLLFFAAAGLSISFGLLNLANLAHGGFYMLGGYIALTVLGATHNFWLALVVPAATPKDIVNKISADTRKVLNDPAFRAKYIDPYGYEVLADTPEEFAAFYKDDLVAAEKRVKISGAKLD